MRRYSIYCYGFYKDLMKCQECKKYFPEDYNGCKQETIRRKKEKKKKEKR